MFQHAKENQFEQLAYLIQQVFELKDLPQANNGVIAIDFEGRYGLRFEYHQSLNEVILYADLTRQPELECVAPLLLKANAYGRGTCGAAFAFDENANRIILEKHFYIPLPEADEFVSILENFLHCLRIWEERLDEQTHFPPAVGSDDSERPQEAALFRV